MSVKTRLEEHCEEESCGLDGLDRDTILSLIEAVEEIKRVRDDNLDMDALLDALASLTVRLKVVIE